MLKEKEFKNKRLEVRVKSSTLEKINKIRDLYRLSQSELIEQIVDNVFEEHQKSGKIE